MTQRNDSMQFFVSALQRGADPKTLVQQFARQDPRMQQVLQLLNGKSPHLQRQFVMNMAKERGIDIENLARSMGFTISSQR